MQPTGRNPQPFVLQQQNNKAKQTIPLPALRTIGYCIGTSKYTSPVPDYCNSPYIVCQTGTGNTTSHCTVPDDVV